MAEAIALPIVLAAQKVIAGLRDLHSAKKHNTTIAQEIDQFINSLNENIDLLKEQLPNKRGSWAIESLTTDLNKAADFLEEGQKNGNFQKFWDAKQIKDELERLRQDLINKFQVKLFVTTLEVVIDADEKMDNFESKMLELSTLSAAQSHAATTEIRKLLQPLVVGIKRQDQSLQSFLSMVRGNETKVETSTETLKFLADVLGNLEDLTDEGSSTKRTPQEDRDEYLDPITMELMSDPVKCTDGDTYDRFSVFRYNLTRGQRKELVIACDDLNVRRKLFQNFADEGVESKFRSLRKEYRDEALKLAERGQYAEALAMLTNVLQWAPDDTECLEQSEEIKEVIAKRQSNKAAQQVFTPSAPPESTMVPPEAPTIGPPEPYSGRPYSGYAQKNQQSHTDLQNVESLALGIIVMILCFPCSLCCIPCLFPNACGGSEIN